MDLITLALLEFIVSLVAPLLVTRNPHISLTIALINVALMSVLAVLFGVV